MLQNMRFITFTANPALDWCIAVDSLTEGGISTATSETVHPGGKGVNVARILYRLGKRVTALYPGGGFSCGEHSSLLTAEGVPHKIFPVPGALRRNVVITAGHTEETFKINSPGAVFPADREEELKSWILSCCSEGDWLILSGSLTPGLSQGFYRKIIEKSRQSGITTVLDSSGIPLREGFDAEPHIAKPNMKELSTMMEQTFTTMEQVEKHSSVQAMAAYTELLVSGGREGALLFVEDGIWRGRCDTAMPHLIVGGGDSLLGGYCASRAEGNTPDEALHQAIAAATATAFAPPHQLALLSEVERCRTLCKVWKV
ncbi:MAG: 1-phosphofructokinase family hexose kinase [Vulcanimicrobiota bacterium]